MPRKLLLTGFEAFGEVGTNPSQQVVDALRGLELPDVEIIADVLPVSYSAGDFRIRELIQDYRPDLLVALGVAARIDAIHLERVALNLDDASSPDNDGVLKQGSAILPGGAPAYFTGLPLAGLKVFLEGAGIPVRISNHAGAYLCNHVYYAACQEFERLGSGSRVVFIHVPLPSEVGEEGRMTTEDIIRAISLSLKYLAAYSIGI